MATAGPNAPGRDAAKHESFDTRYNSLLKKIFTKKVIFIQREWRRYWRARREQAQETDQSRCEQSVSGHSRRSIGSRTGSANPMGINDILKQFLGIKRKYASSKLTVEEKLAAIERDYFSYLRKLEIQNRSNKSLKQLLMSVFFLSKKLEIYPE